MELRELIFSIQGRFFSIYPNVSKFVTHMLPTDLCGITSVNSAVDQFRKQFSHLEENGGKSGPVIPLQRKHVSLPR